MNPTLLDDCYGFLTARMGVDGARHIQLPMDAGRYLPNLRMRFDTDGALAGCNASYKAGKIRRAAYKGCLQGDCAQPALRLAQHRADDETIGFDTDAAGNPAYLDIYPCSPNWREGLAVPRTESTLQQAAGLLGEWLGAVESLLERLPDDRMLSRIRIPLLGQARAKVGISPICVPTRGLHASPDGLPVLLGRLGMAEQAEAVEGWLADHPQADAAHSWELTLELSPEGALGQGIEVSLIAAFNHHKRSDRVRTSLVSPRDERYAALLAGSLSDEQQAKVARAAKGFRMPYLNDGFQLEYLRIYAKVTSLSLVYDGTRMLSACPDVLFSIDWPDSPKSRWATQSVVQWHITDACDQRCKHCYIFAEDSGICLTTTPYDDLIDTLDQLDAYCDAHGRDLSPVVTGGDPILHPRFWDFAQEMYRRGMNFSMLGNPFHLTQEVCDRLFDLGCREYQLSVDGLEEFHDSLRKPGSFKATMEALPLLQNAGIMPMAMLTVSGANIDQVPAVARLCVERRFGSFTFARYCPTSRENALELHIEPQRYRRFLNDMLDLYEELRGQDVYTRLGEKEHLFTLAHWERGEFAIPEKAVPGRIYDGCHCGQHMTILPNRDVLACRRMDSLVGNLNEGNIEDIHLGPKDQEFRAAANLEKCSRCRLYGWCRGCLAVGAGYTGDWHSADPQCWMQVDE